MTAIDGSIGSKFKEFESVCDSWENDLLERYPKDSDDSSDNDFGVANEGLLPINKDKEQFRVYTEENQRVANFYAQNHKHQTLDFVLKLKMKYCSLEKMEMSIWEAMEYLNQLVDESDPDTQLSQIHHLLQTAEALRRDKKPDWMILAGLIHDLGKILILFGEPQWAVVGDTFPVGCAYSKKIVHSEYFVNNPDYYNETYQTQNGIYEPHCGFDNVHLSFGHDEYLYHVTKNYLPKEALYIIRYHSFYPAHRENEYQHLMNDFDHEMMKHLREFNPYDLYSKSHDMPDVEKLKPYYLELISKYFPDKIKW